MTTEPPKRKRRWLRFSLKTFVVVLTVFCVWLGALVYRVNKKKEAVQWVKENGGDVYYDFEWEHDLMDGAEPPGPDWLRDLIGLDYFADVVFVDVNNTQIKDLEPLRELTQLHQLYLYDTQVTEKGVAKLQQALPNCDIYWSPVTAK